MNNNNNHKEDCRCFYCDEKAQEDIKNLFTQQPNFCNNFDNKQDIHCFMKQNKEEVADLIKKAACAGKIFQEEEKEPKLSGSNLPDCDITLERGKSDFFEEYSCYDWRTLAGINKVNPTIIAEEDNYKLLLDNILKKINLQFTTLTLSWDKTEVWNPTLMINESRTKIKFLTLAEVTENLQKLVDEAEAIDIVVAIVIKKIKNLF